MKAVVEMIKEDDKITVKTKIDEGFMRLECIYGLLKAAEDIIVKSATPPEIEPEQK